MRWLLPAVVASGLVTSCAILRPAAPLPPLTAVQRDGTFTREDARADLDTLLALVDEVHPNPYSIVTRDSLRRAEAALIAELPPTFGRLRLGTQAQRLVALVGDGHTSIYPPGDELLNALALGKTTLPFSVVHTERGWTIGNSLDANVHAGDRIVRINGGDIDSLMRVFAQEIPAELEPWRVSRLGSSFASRLFAHDIRAPFQVEALRGDRSLHFTLPGATRAQLDSANKARASVTQNVAGLAYRALPGRVAYLDFQTMIQDESQFRHAADSIFDRINADSSTGLVIDLRRNGGGNSSRGDDLLTYLTDTPYVTVSKKEWKMSRRYRQQIASQVVWWLHAVPFSWFGHIGHEMFGGPDGKIAVLADSETTRPAANPRRVVRPVCVLIGPGTFSSAMLFANVIKQNHLATLIGEPTGEPPNSFGEVYGFRLPLSGLQGQVSTARWTLDRAPDGDRRGVLPDVATTRTAVDVEAGRDPALERAIACGTADGVTRTRPERR